MSIADGQVPSWQEKLSCLIKGEAFLSSPEDFNDPFDCLPHFRTPERRSSIPSFLDSLASKIARSVEDFDEPQIRDKLEQNLAGIDPDELSLIIQKSMIQTSGRLGVFCLTESIKNVLMWSHYAANHQGIAVGFRFDLFQRNGLMPIMKVTYEPERPAIDVHSPDEHKNEIADALAVKADFWKYENEWRCIRPNSKHEFLRFDPTIIDRIVFGAKCTKKVRSEVRNIVNRSDFSYFEVSPQVENFELRFREV